MQFQHPVLAILCLTGLAGHLPAQGQRHLDDKDLAPLGDALKALTEARAQALRVAEARAELETALEALRPKAAGRDPLGFPADLGHALGLSLDVAGGKAPRAGKVVEDSFEGGSFVRGLAYAFQLPKGYDPEAATYPLILAIPDVGEKPAEHLRSNWNESPFKDKLIVVVPEMPAERAEWDQVMVAGRPGGLSHVLTALRVATERFAVDFDRVFVVGHGKGVPAAVAVGNYSPQRFAGIIGRHGDLTDSARLGPDNFGNLPTLFVAGASNARAFHDTAREAGNENCRLEPRASAEELWHWMLEHPRQASPSALKIVVGQPFPTRVYWLRVAPSAPDARAEASIDRESNTVTIEGHGISHATLYLNDALVDLDKPLKVVCNDTEHEELLPRRLSTLLDLFFDGTSDPQNVYVSEARFDMQAGAVVAATDGVGEDPEFDEKLGEAGEDTSRLWELARWCRENQRETLAQGVLARLLRVDPDHAQAREALGHRGAPGQWFASEASFERYRESQDEAVARARGYVKHKSIWLHKEDRARASRGLEKDPDLGLWLSLAERKKLSKGWVLQDLEWIAPDEVAFVDRGLWKVDGEWLGLEKANRRHARIERMWHIPSAEVLLHTTTDRHIALRAIRAMEQALAECRRVFGAEPVLPLPVTVLRDEEQYDRFALGDPDGRRLAGHAGRLHLIHSAFYAESRLPFVEGKRTFDGMGVCYWDTHAPHGDLYGVNAARLAAGLSYAEALDPSTKSVRAATARGPKADYYESYQAEKKIPAWLRWGAAVYAERFYEDPSVGPDGDRWWARNWSLDNLRNKGGLRELDEIFAFALKPEERADGQKLQIEAGLLVAFLLDGGSAPVTAAHETFKAGLVSGRLHPNQVQALEQAVRDQQAELKAFSGL